MNWRTADLRSFTYDPVTKKVKVDYGFNLPPNPADWHPDPTDFPNEVEESEDDEP
jgi:hypothetical protein